MRVERSRDAFSVVPSERSSGVHNERQRKPRKKREEIDERPKELDDWAYIREEDVSSGCTTDTIEISDIARQAHEAYAEFTNTGEEI